MTLVVVGGTVAALVAAEHAARLGADVELLLPRKGVGGGFAPITVGPRRLERGIRVLELHYEGVGDPPPLAAYDPGADGHRPHTRRVREHLEQLVGADRVVVLDEPRQYLDGRLGPEVLLRTDAEALASWFDEATRARILAELGDGAGPLAPERAGELWAGTLEDASREAHGPTLHAALVDAFARKIRPEGVTDVPTALRRKLWLPLFWPATLREALSGARVGFRPQRPFSAIEPGGVGAIIDALLQRLADHPRVAVRRTDGVASVQADAGDVLVGLRDGSEPVRAHEPIIALAPGELFAAAQIPYEPARVVSVLTWVEVADADILELPSFVHVLDRDLPVLRCSRGERTPAGTAVCVELAHGVAEADAHAAAVDGLQRIGLVREGAAPAALATFRGPTFTAPTHANLAAFEQARAALELPARLIGGVERFGADAFNEQVVQGLAAAEARVR